jgi:hemerythrin-like metal-binding protein
MDLMWTSDLETGIKPLDDQHRSLFRMLDAFRAACDDGRGGESLLDLLTFLQAYVEEHFVLEEIHMRGAGFPGLAAHKTSHDALRKDLETLVATVKSEGPDPSLVSRTTLFITGWLRLHIGGFDKPMARFLADATGAFPWPVAGPHDAEIRPRIPQDP